MPLVKALKKVKPKQLMDVAEFVGVQRGDATDLESVDSLDSMLG